jgi:hypothetical protein
MLIKGEFHQWNWKLNAYLVSVGAKRNTERSGKTEIGQFQVAFTVNQQILRLQVTVQNSVAMAVSDSFNKLGHELFDHGITQAQGCTGLEPIGQGLPSPTVTDRQSLHVFLKVEIEEFEDKVELVAIGVNNVQQLNNVGVLHLLQEGDLANCSAGNALIFGFEANLLQGNDTIGVIEFTGLVDHTVGAYRASTRELSSR